MKQCVQCTRGYKPVGAFLTLSVGKLLLDAVRASWSRHRRPATRAHMLSPEVSTGVAAAATTMELDPSPAGMPELQENSASGYHEDEAERFRQIQVSLH